MVRFGVGLGLLLGPAEAVALGLAEPRGGFERDGLAEGEWLGDREAEGAVSVGLASPEAWPGHWDAVPVVLGETTGSTVVAAPSAPLPPPRPSAKIATAPAATTVAVPPPISTARRLPRDG